MGNHNRIETSDMGSFQTTRTINSRLWFVNNSNLERAILGYAAKYKERYGVKIYGLAIEGNHIQFPALFPGCNRSSFMRDFNSSVARNVPRYQKMAPKGPLWAKHYSAEHLPNNQDIEEQFFYTALQTVQDGLVSDINDYPGYNFFEDAITDTRRKYPVVHWKEYNDARRWDDNVSIKDYTENIELVFDRVPGYEQMTQAEYAEMMREKLKERTKAIIDKRAGKPFAGAKSLRKVKPGAIPHKTKTSSINDHRPRILCKDPERRKKALVWYFSIYAAYKEASLQFRAGNLTVEFPAGTYRPPMFTVVRAGF